MPAISVGLDGRLVIEKPTMSIARKDGNKPDKNRYLFVDFLKNRAELIAARFPFLIRMSRRVVTGGILLPRNPGIVSGWYTAGWEERWQVTSHLIEYMADMVRNQAGLEFDVVFIPSPFQVEPVFKQLVADYAVDNPTYKTFLEDMDRPQRMLMALCEERKIQCVDATETLRAASRTHPTYFLHEGHLNAYGTGVLSDLFEQLIRH